MNKNADELTNMADELGDAVRMYRESRTTLHCLSGIAGETVRKLRTIAARPQDGVAGLVVTDAMVLAACNAHDPMYDICGGDTRADMRAGMRRALTAALATQPPARDGGWFAVDVDALMEAATRAVINCNFYAEIDGVAYSRLPTKDMSALGDLILSAIGEKA